MVPHRGSAKNTAKTGAFPSFRIHQQLGFSSTSDLAGKSGLCKWDPFSWNAGPDLKPRGSCLVKDGANLNCAGFNPVWRPYFSTMSSQFLHLIFPKFWIKASGFFFSTSMAFLECAFQCTRDFGGLIGTKVMVMVWKALCRLCQCGNGLKWTKGSLQMTSTRLQLHCITGQLHPTENSSHPLTGPNLRSGQGLKYQWWPAHVDKNPRLCLRLWQAASSSLSRMEFRTIQTLQFWGQLRLRSDG